MTSLQRMSLARCTGKGVSWPRSAPTFHMPMRQGRRIAKRSTLAQPCSGPSELANLWFCVILGLVFVLDASLPLKLCRKTPSIAAINHHDVLFAGIMLLWRFQAIVGALRNQSS